MSDEHPADGLAQAFHDLISGEGFKQTLRQAWDRMHSSPGVHQQEIDTANKAAMDKSTQDANKSFLTPQGAANVRAKANKALGGK